MKKWLTKNSKTITIVGVIVAIIGSGFFTSASSVAYEVYNLPETIQGINKKIEQNMAICTKSDSIMTQEILKSQKIESGTQVEIRNLNEKIDDLGSDIREIRNILLRR